MKAWVEESNQPLSSNCQNVPSVSDIIKCLENIPPSNVNGKLSQSSPPSSLNTSVKGSKCYDSSDVTTINRNLKLNRAATAKPRYFTTGATRQQSKKMMTSPENFVSESGLPKALIVYGESLNRGTYFGTECQKTKMQYCHSAPTAAENRCCSENHNNNVEIGATTASMSDNAENHSNNAEIGTTNASNRGSPDTHINSADICTMAASSLAHCKRKSQAWSETNMKNQREAVNSTSTRWALNQAPVHNAGRAVENGIHLINIPTNSEDKTDKIYESIDTERLLQLNLSDPAVVRELTNNLTLKQTTERKQTTMSAPPASRRCSSLMPSMEVSSAYTCLSSNREMPCVFTQNNNDFEVPDPSLKNGSMINIRKISSPVPSLCSISSSSSSLSSSVPINPKTCTMGENIKNNQYTNKISSKSSPTFNDVQNTESNAYARPVQLLCTHSGRLLHTTNLTRTNSSNSKTLTKEKLFITNAKDKIFLRRTDYSPIQMVYDEGVNTLVPKTPSTVTRYLQRYFNTLYRKQEQLQEERKSTPSLFMTPYTDLAPQNLYKTIQTMKFDKTGPQMIVKKMLIGQNERKLQRPQTTQNTTNSKSLKMKQRPQSGPSQVLCKEKESKLQSSLPDVLEGRDNGKEECGSGAFHRTASGYSVMDNTVQHYNNDGILRNTDQSLINSEIEEILDKGSYQTDQSKLRPEREKPLDISVHHTDQIKFKLGVDKIQNNSDSPINQFTFRPEIEETQCINEQSIWKSEVKRSLNKDGNNIDMSKFKPELENNLNKADLHTDQSELQPEVENVLNRNPSYTDQSITKIEERIVVNGGHKSYQPREELDIEKVLKLDDQSKAGPGTEKISNLDNYQKDMIKFRPEAEEISNSINNNNNNKHSPNTGEVLNNSDHQIDQTLINFQSDVEQVLNSNQFKLELDVQEVLMGGNTGINGSSISTDQFNNDKQYMVETEKIPNNYANIDPTKPKSEIEVTPNNNSCHIDSAKSKPETEVRPSSNTHNVNCKPISKIEVTSNNKNPNTDPLSGIGITPSNSPCHSAKYKPMTEVSPRTNLNTTVYSKPRSEVEVSPNNNDHNMDSANLQSDLKQKSHQLHKVHFDNVMEEISEEIPQLTNSDQIPSGILDKSLGNLQPESESTNELKTIDSLRSFNKYVTRITPKVNKNHHSSENVSKSSAKTISEINQEIKNSNGPEKSSQETISNSRVSEIDTKSNNNIHHINSGPSKSETQVRPSSNTHNVNCKPISKIEVTSNNKNPNTDPRSEIRITPNNSPRHFDSAKSRSKAEVTPKTKINKTVLSKPRSAVEVSPNNYSYNTDSTKFRSKIEATSDSSPRHIDSGSCKPEIEVRSNSSDHSSVHGKPMSKVEVTSNNKIHNTDPRSEIGITPNNSPRHSAKYKPTTEVSPRTKLNTTVRGKPRSEVEVSPNNNDHNMDSANLQSDLKQKSHQLRKVHFEISEEAIPDSNPCHIDSSSSKPEIDVRSNSSDHGKPMSKVEVTSNNKQDISKINSVSGNTKKPGLGLTTEKLETNKESANNKLSLLSLHKKDKKMSVSHKKTEGLPDPCFLKENHSKLEEYSVVKDAIDAEVSYLKQNVSRIVNQASVGDKTEVAGGEKNMQRNLTVKENISPINFTRTSKYTQSEKKDSSSMSEMSITEDKEMENIWKHPPASRSYSSGLNYQREVISSALLPPPKLKSKKRSASSKKSKSKSDKSPKKTEKDKAKKPLFFNSVKQKEPQNDNDYTCKNISDKLRDKGVTVSWITLERGLYPPNERPLHYTMEASKEIYPGSDLLNHPKSWLPKEFNALQKVVRKLKLADQYLWKQGRSVSKKNKHSGSSRVKIPKKKKKK